MKFLIILGLFVFSTTGSAQVDSTSPPYKRFPTLPPFKILLSDSSTVYAKTNLPEDKAVFLLLFSPDCSHCQHTTEQLIAHREEMKDLQIVMITMHPVEKMREFIAKYRLTDLPNVVVGRDIYYITPPFFSIKNLPFFAMYNQKGELISGFDGALGIPEVIQIFKTHKE